MNYFQQQQPRFSTAPPVVKNLLIANVIAFLATYLLKRQGIDLIDLFGMHYFESPKFKIYQIITCMFLHGGFLHIALNMYGLWLFGQMLENYLGSKRFLNLYAISGIGAGIVQEISLYVKFHDLGIPFDSVTIGASGALFGVLIAFAMIFSEVELFFIFIPIPIKAKYAIPLYGAFELFSGLANSQADNIAHFAHLGGMLFGFLLVLYWRKKQGP